MNLFSQSSNLDFAKYNAYVCDFVRKVGSFAREVLIYWKHIFSLNSRAHC